MAREGEGEGKGEDRLPANRLEPTPTVIVLGYMDGNIALRLGWRHGMHVFSNSRFKFMREDLELNVVDNPEEYLF